MQKTDASKITSQNKEGMSQDRPKFETIKELFQSMPLGLNRTLAENMDTVIQFNLSGQEPTNGYFIIKNGTCTYDRGSHPNPTTTINADSNLWLSISNRETSGEKAFINKQYTAEGDMTILLKFDQLFSLPGDEEQVKIPAYKTDFDYHVFAPGTINNIVVFDGGPRNSKFSKTLLMVNHFCAGAQSVGAHVEHVKLIKQNIHPCTGCYTCWTKTPGQCIFEDDMAELRLKFRMADLILFASPLYVFSVTGIMKSFLDRIIPNIQPYMQKCNGGTRHPHRFADDKKQGFIVFSAAGFPEVAGNFDGLKSMFRCFHSHSEKTFLMGEFFLPGAELISQPVYTERRQRIEQACHQAGKQAILEGKITPVLMETVSDPEISQANFQEYANYFWESLDGKAAYKKGAPKLEYNSVLTV